MASPPCLKSEISTRRLAGEEQEPHLCYGKQRSLEAKKNKTVRRAQAEYGDGSQQKAPRPALLSEGAKRTGHAVIGVTPMARGLARFSGWKTVLVGEMH